MTDEEVKTAVAVAAASSAVGIMGGSVAALNQNLTRKQIFATIISSLGFSSTAPAMLVSVWGVHPVLAVFVGFLLGLSCVGLTAYITAATKNPGYLIIRLIPFLRAALDKAQEQQKADEAKNAITEKKDGGP